MQEKKWTLKVLYHLSDNSADVLAVSADAAKREARKYKKSAQTRWISFRIYSPGGSLYQYTEIDSSWRLRWVWGK